MIHHPRLGGLARPAVLTVRGLALRALAKRARQPRPSTLVHAATATTDRFVGHVAEGTGARFAHRRLTWKLRAKR